MKIANKERQRRRAMWHRRIKAIAPLLFWCGSLVWAVVFMVLGVHRMLTTGTIGGELLAPLLPIIICLGADGLYDIARAALGR